jgi:sugar lactone lactonase YvrE
VNTCAEQLTPVLAYHGEGPVWDSALQRLLWVDLLKGDLLVTDPGGETQRRHVADVLACVVPRAAGGHVFATERGFALADADGEVTPRPEVWADTDVRMNDGGCDPQGRFYCGSMAYGAAPGRGALFRLDPDRSVHQVHSGVTISNGMGWTPDATAAYYVDSATQQIDVCSADLVLREPFVRIAAQTGTPDGLTVDAEGGVWVALWGGSAVHRYSPSGTLDAVISLPAAQVSSCAFGGADLDTLFITTSAEGLASPEPEAGALFAVRPGVRGLPTLPFGG